MINRKDFEVKIEALDYHKCAKHIESVLGYELTDTLGRWSSGEKKDVEYRNFWHFVLKNTDGIHNGSKFLLPLAHKTNQPWQNEILEAFKDAFGEDQEYWVEW